MKLYGKNPILERLRVAPSSIQKIYLQQGISGGIIQKKARQHNISILITPSSKIQKLARNKNTQGFVADVSEFEYVEFSDILQMAFTKNRCPVFLDGITDPQNLGAILRSLACLGRFSVVLPKHESVSVTETTLRIASGGENFVPVSKVSSISSAIKMARDQGLWVAGMVVESGQLLDEVKFPRQTGIVIGSEQKGIRDVVAKILDARISIPMHAQTISFNAAHAVTVVCYEITRQQRQKKNG